MSMRPGCVPLVSSLLSIFYSHPAPPEIHTLSLHDALPILLPCASWAVTCTAGVMTEPGVASHLVFSAEPTTTDRKSTRLNSSHITISYAVFCLKKKIEYRHNLSLAHLNLSAVCYPSFLPHA